MDIVHSATERVQIVRGFSTLLQLALQSAKNVVEREVIFPRSPCRTTHATHTEALRLHCPSSLRSRRTIRPSLASKVECSTDTGSSCIEAEAGTLGFRPCGGLRILVGEHTYDTGSNFMMNNGLVVFSDNVYTEFLQGVNLVSMMFGRVTYHYIIGLELKRLRLEPFGTQTFAVDECTIGAFDVLDENLHICVNNGCIRKHSMPTQIRRGARPPVA